MVDKKILVIGNEIAFESVGRFLFPQALGVYDVVNYSGVQSQSGRAADYSSEAITAVINQHGANYSAILVDLVERQAAQAARDAGFTKPIIGIGSHPSDQIAGADIVLAFRSGTDTSILRKTLDKLVK